MSKRAQQNQSAFNVGNKIGLVIAKNYGKIGKPFFNSLFKTHYRGERCWQSVARSGARIGYANGLEKAAKAAQFEPLTGEDNAQL